MFRYQTKESRLAANMLRANRPRLLKVMYMQGATRRDGG
jgi:hypothetical protein